MKRVLPLLALLLLGLTNLATASHTIGGEIAYKRTSGNTYQVTFKEYRDCGAAQHVASQVIKLEAPGCNTGRFITLNQVSRKQLKPYGPLIPVTCSVSSPQFSVEVVTFTGTLTFTAAEAACPDWVLSWNECCRPSTANLVGQDNLYTEAKLKLISGLVNNSPAFDTLNTPVMFVSLGRRQNLSMMAVDPDGDSLVYKLEAPLTFPNTPVPYKPTQTGIAPLPGFPPNIFINPAPLPPYANPFTPQLAQLTGSPVPPTYTPQYPMPTINVNWTSAPTIPFAGAPLNGMIWEAKNLFEINPVNGELKFTPTRYVQGASQPSGENKYTVSIMVEEYRKVNGVMTKLGSVRRETMIVVSEVMNRNPETIVRSANNQNISPGYEIQLRPGTPLSLYFVGFEPDTNYVTVSTNATYILPGASITPMPGTVPAGEITWVPTAADVRWQPYYFQVVFRDDANPLRGVWAETFAVRVNQTGGVTGVKDAELSAAIFSAYPNPFSEELNFSLNLQTKAESIVIYNLLGQKVDEISLKTVGLGEQKVQWQNAGKHAAGTYVARLVSADKTVQTLKFTKLQ